MKIDRETALVHLRKGIEDIADDAERLLVIGKSITLKDNAAMLHIVSIKQTVRDLRKLLIALEED